MKYVVNWGLTNRQLDNVESIGVDEIAWKKGHKYLTLVYQIDSQCTRLLWIGQGRTVKTFLRFFRIFGKENSAKLVTIQLVSGILFTSSCINSGNLPLKIISTAVDVDIPRFLQVSMYDLSM